MQATTVQRAFFAALLFIVTLTFLWLIRGFLQPIFWAIALAIVMYPIHRRLDRRLRHRASLAALISMLLIVLIVLLPLAGIIAAITTEAAALYQRLEAGDFQLNQLYASAQQHLPQLIHWLNAFGVNVERLQAQLSAAAVGTSRFIASRVLAIGQNTLRIAIYFFIMLYLLFFFLRDGMRMLDGLVSALPLGDERERQLLARFAEVSRATIKGTLVIGIVQGALGGIAFWVLGIAAPVLWGAVMALMSILPAIGPAVVWMPAAIVLLVSGHVAGGIALILVGMFVIGSVDNLLRPILVGRDTRMPDYLVLLSTLGGLAGFGLAGIVIGPIIAAFFLSCWHMAGEEFGEDAWSGKTLPAPTDEPSGGPADSEGEARRAAPARSIEPAARHADTDGVGDAETKPGSAAAPAARGAGRDGDDADESGRRDEGRAKANP